MQTRLIPVLALILCIVPIKGFSGPDKTTNHLMSDSASMLDFGLLRLNLKLDAGGLGSAWFDWDENRIKVRQFLRASEISEGPEEACATWVSKVRLSAGVLETGTTFYANSIFADMFSHYGFKRNLAPEGLLKDIDKLIVLDCQVYGPDTHVRVTAPLVGTGYSLAR